MILGTETTEQPLLFGDTLQSAFNKFDTENPHVYEFYKKFAFALLACGRKRCSIALLTERIRWEVYVTTSALDFKINNNFRSRYARKLMTEYPELQGMFSTRKLHTS